MNSLTDRDSSISPIPLTIIGGFLGSGKTSLLNHIINSTQGKRFAVLVNDFGEINIDAKLIVSVEGETISLASILISPKSFTSTANRFPRVLLIMWFNRDVLPDPRKPPIIVTGIGAKFTDVPSLVVNPKSIIS